MAELRRTRGFTLIEMMVALAVLSFAGLALIRLESAVARSAATLDASAVAQIVARNIAVEALTDAQPPTLGAAEGVEENGGRRWRWQRTVAPIGDAGALRIDVRVSGENGAGLGRLMVVRPPPPRRAPNEASQPGLAT